VWQQWFIVRGLRGIGNDVQGERVRVVFSDLLDSQLR
jgi:hypothetical protein